MLKTTVSSQVLVADEVLAADEVGGVEGGDESIVKSTEPKTGKSSKFTQGFSGRAVLLTFMLKAAELSKVSVPRVMGVERR